MDYPYGMFGDCSFSRFGFIVCTDRQNHTLTHATCVEYGDVLCLCSGVSLHTARPSTAEEDIFMVSCSYVDPFTDLQQCSWL